MINIIMVIAIISGPIVAVQVQKFIERLRARRQAKETIFKTLMSTRGTPISVHHVQALNMIDLEFYGKKKKDKKVVDSWKIYRDHLYNHPKDPKDPDYKSKFEAWTEKSNDLLTDLLFEMAHSLNYDFDKVHLKRGAYTPRGHSDTELAQLFLRDRLVALFAGETAIPIRLWERPLSKELKNSQKQDAKSSRNETKK